jgi:UPF0755 protein
VELIKIVVRVALFVMAVASLVVLGIVGIEFIAGQMQPAAPKPEIAAVQLIERQADLPAPEEFILNIYMRMKQQDIDTPVSDDPTPIDFTIAQGEAAILVAQRLQEAGLIKDGGLFRWYMRYYGVDSKLAAGDYKLARNMNMPQIAKALQHALYEETSIQIIEGWRAEQIAEMLARKGLVTVDEFMETVNSGQYNYSVLNDRPASVGLEGYLFPDTYRINANANAAQIIDKLIATLDARFDESRRARAAARGLSTFQVLNLASIVEREAVVAQERPMIADVYLNRMKKGMYLQADPTVQYALGFQPRTNQWWLLPLPIEALSETISVYNTYLNPGLPPHPICNPSLASIDAVLSPAGTDYLFFYSKGDGSHAFAKTYEEHLRNQALYQQ